MKPERWDVMTIQDREISLRKHTGRDPRWAPLIERMSNSRFAELTDIQKEVVKELKG